MEKVYKSLVAGWYKCTCIVMLVAFLASLYLCYKSTWILLIDVVLVGFCVYMMFDMLFHTDYTIKGDRLLIRCGFMFRMELPIRKIIEITDKSTILSSPALSAKRIGLRYGRTNWVYLSPENRSGFISDLLSLNPGIKYLAQFEANR